MNKYLDAMAKPFMPITPWLLRLGLGIAFIYHGIGKFPLPPERMVTWFESMGFMYPEIVTSLVALGEVGAGAPAPTSPKATRLVTISGYIKPMLSNQVTILSGGSGNLPIP